MKRMEKIQRERERIEKFQEKLKVKFQKKLLENFQKKLKA